MLLLRVSRPLLMRRCNVMLAAAAKRGAGTPKTLMEKVRAEAIKMVKIQVVLIPVLAILLLFFFPIPSVEEEKRMRIQYEQRAGWKT